MMDANVGKDGGVGWRSGWGVGVVEKNGEVYKDGEGRWKTLRIPDEVLVGFVFLLFCKGHAKMPYSRPDIEAPDPDVSISGPDHSSETGSGKSSPTDNHTYHAEHAAPGKASVAAKLRNPLAGMSEASVLADVDAFVSSKGLSAHRETFRKGALVARVGQRDDGFEYVGQLSEEEKGLLRREVSHRWDHPFALYFLVVLCAGSAIVQGMDQTAVNGAQVSWEFVQRGEGKGRVKRREG